jgi:hypothetical protein
MTNILIGTGLEDALSLAKLGRSERIIGVPGDGALQNLNFARGTRANVVRDGDKNGSAADQAIVAGIDALLIQKVDAYITPTPEGEDANSIWQKQGAEGLATLVDSAAPVELSKPWGIIKYLATLDRLQYEAERARMAKHIGWRVSVLDDAVAQLRDAKRFHAEDADNDEGGDSEDGELAVEVDLAEALDRIVKELARYVVASDDVYTTIALWAAHTHLVHHPVVKLTVSPRLAIQAEDASSGKTITLEAVGCLVPCPRMAASVTASSVFRSIVATKPVYLIDEADQVLKHPDRNPELVAILNASHRRKTAFIERSVPLPDGGWTVERFDVWCTMAMASIGELPRTQQERSVVVHLDKALVEDVKEHLEDGESAEFAALRRLLAAWARDLGELPRPVLPTILTKQAGRVADNWRPLLAVAQLAGERWRKRAEDAVQAAINAERRLSPVQRLLISIRRAFTPPITYGHDDKEIIPKPIDRLETKELLPKLIADRSEEWDTANRGRSITQYWLRENLRGLLDPKGTKDWWEGTGPARRHCSGYYKYQFDKAWRSHLAGMLGTLSPSQETSGASGSSGEPFDKKGEFTPRSGTASGASGADGAVNAEPDAPDSVPDGVNKSINEINDVPDAPDAPDVRGADGSISVNGSGTDDPQQEVSHDLADGKSANGQDGPINPRLDVTRNLVEEQIVNTWREHKDWSAIKIARECGVTRKRVQTVLSKYQNGGATGAAL